MKRVVFLLMLACACERIDVVGGGGGDADDSTDFVYHAAAVSYPVGYDWRKDSLAGDVYCQMIFFRKDEEICRFDVNGSNRETDVDMHRIIGGHLYSFGDENGGTVVRRDGRELFRLEDPERICDIQVTGASVYTLGVRPSIQGICYRKDGNKVSEYPNAFLAGGFHVDGGNLCFSVAVNLSPGADSSARRYYLVRDGIPQLLEVKQDVSEIFAAHSFRSSVNTLEKPRNFTGILWEDGNGVARTLDLMGASGIRACSFVRAGGNLLAHAQILLDGGDGIRHWNDCWWSRDALVARTFSENQVCAFCKEAPVLCYAVSPYASSSPVTVSFDGNAYTMSPDFRMISPYALTCSERRFTIAGNEGLTPLVIRDLDTLKYDFNGYFTCVSLP